MKAERLFTIIGLVDEDLVEEAGSGAKRPWTQTLGTVVAACLALSLAAGPMAALLTPKGMKEEAPAASAPAASAPAAAEPQSPGTAPESEPFLSYAGPVLPLIGVKDSSLTAYRALDFNISESSAAVKDTYLLTNPTDADLTFTAYYPVTGSLGEMDNILPSILVDGSTVETSLYAGQYAGTFVSAYGSDEPSHRDNLFQPNTWSFYDQALSRDDLASALEDAPALDESVTVYAFSDFVTRPDYDAATLAMEFTIAPEKTTILTHGFNGSSWDTETGWRQYDFFLPNGQRMDTEPKLLVIRGEDIHNYTLAGYTNGGCEEPLEGLSCTVTRYETTMGALLEELCRSYLAAYASGANISGLLKSDPENISLALFYRCAAQLLTEHGPLAEAPAERYAFGRLDDIVSEALILERLFYTAFEVTVPAGSSVTVEAACRKAASFDFPGTDRQGIYGYDLLTYGFPTELTVTGAAITAGNAESGMTLEEETHYYFEVNS